jgi:hypothetical protein
MSANAKRLRMAALRRYLRTETGALEDILRDPPAEFEDWPLIDVVRLGYNKRGSVACERLGRLAVRDGVNLLVPLGRASLRSREWIIKHARWWWTPSTSGRARCYVHVDDEEDAA